MDTLTLSIPSSKRPFGSRDVLVYYDGPLLFWLPCPGCHLLAMALPDEVGAWPFLVMELTAEQAIRLTNEELTVRSACLASSACWVLRDYGAETLMLEPLATIPEDWLPSYAPLQPDKEGTA